MDGRVVMTSVFTDFDLETAGIQLFSTGKVTVNRMQAWSVDDIWISQENL